MTARVIDFDSFRREKDAAEGREVELPAMVVGGKTYVLPADLPASIAMEVMRLNKEKGAGADVPPETLFSLGEQLFGKDALTEILEKTRMGVKGMGDLITQAFRLYDPNMGKETIPNRKARRASGAKRSTSSKTGR